MGERRKQRGVMLSIDGAVSSVALLVDFFHAVDPLVTASSMDE